MSRSLLPRLKRRNKKATRPAWLRLPVDGRRLGLGVATVLVLSFLMSIHFMPDRVSLNLGDRSPTEIRASRSVSYVDTEATLRRREYAAARVSSIYEPDPTAVAQATRYVSDLFENVRRVRGNTDLTTPAEKLKSLSNELKGVFTQEQLRFLVAAPSGAVDRLAADARRLVEGVMNGDQIRSNTSDLEHAREKLAETARTTVSATTEVSVLDAVAKKALRPNHIFNERLTRQERDRKVRSEEPVIGEIRYGDVILHQGDIFTQLHLDQCAALGLVNPRIDAVTALSICVLAAAMVLLVAFFIRRFYPVIYETPSLLLLLSATVIFSVFGLKLFGQVLGLPLSIAQLGYFGMMMVVAAGMIITVLLNAPLAILVTGLLSVQSGLIMNHELRFSVMTMISSLVGIYSVSNIRDRGHLLRATVALAVTNLALVWVIGGLLGDTLEEVVKGSAWAVLAAGIGIGLFWFAVALLEKPFGILTHAWLLELSASEHPLLRQLCITAPGTYAHSIMVGNLAEAAAEAVGADTLFCRVASYYHDAGKLRRPHCFVENQHSENIHDRLNPSLSALIISSHVRDGLELAEEHKLPRQIRAVIAEHHGTSLIRYFYHQAISCGQGETRPDALLEQHFRYDGPRPQTRESGIIMLADTVEAAARCLDKPSPARIQGLVEALVHDKLTDGQLDECDLTFREIGKIQGAFVRVLSAMLHGRIDYPDLPKADAGRTDPGASQAVMPNGSLYPELPKPPRHDEAAVASRADGPPR
jgi:cyclic-di-AMP phosphodiesterase PgpH